MLLYGGAKGPVHFTHIQCSGNEENLLQCSHSMINNRGPGSDYAADFGVSCGKLSSTYIAFRVSSRNVLLGGSIYRVLLSVAM